METVKNKVVIITGASSGIGAATAKLLVKNGAKVVLGARREDRLRSLSESLGDAAVWARANVVSAEEFYDNVALNADSVVEAVLFAVSQPSNAALSDLVIRPSRKS